MLLLSVLPPVIPRASWPCAEHCIMGHGVTFNSEPHLEDAAGGSTESCPEGGQGTNKLSVIGKLMNIFDPRASSRKASSVSYTGGGSVGIAAALKAHMGYIAGLVPSSKSRSSSLDSSSNTSRHYVKKDGDDLLQRRVSRLFSREDSDEESPRQQARSSQSLSHRVSFSILHEQNSQPSLKVRGSPRFPHRIVPTCSLDRLGYLPPAPHHSKCRSLEDNSDRVGGISPLPDTKTEEKSS